MKQAFDQALLNKLRTAALGIRIDSLRATSAAGSGHPTSCLSAADMISAIFFHTLRYNYNDPLNPNNDRFILSKGHAVPAIYAALHQLGVITEADLLSYRDINSDFEGHPTPRFIHNQAATGSLGQGLSIGLGMAYNARHDNLGCRTYVMMGDSEIAEGSVWEAAELAAHDHIDSLTALVDVNRLGQSGEAIDGYHIERVAQKFAAFGWKALVIDGHSVEDILIALDIAHETKGKPTAIIAKTQKGYGLDAIENKPGFHGKPFKQEELPGLIEGMEKRFGITYKMHGEQSVPVLRSHLGEVGSKGEHKLQIPLSKDPNKAHFAMGKKISTRKAFGYALEALGRADSRVFALDAEVKNSTFTEMFGNAFPDRFIQCFVAEQNMLGVATGLALRGKIPFASTFASFFSRAYDQVRMAAVGQVALRLCGSHSGVSIGQDGPSQMGLEDLSMMRAIPGSIVVWPSDGVCAYKLVEQMAMYNDGVSYMKSTRADMPVLYPETEAFPLGECKVLRQSGNDVACIIAAGITLYEALQAHDILKAQGVHVAVVDLYSIKPLNQKMLADIVQKAGNRVITVEDHYPEGGLGEALTVALANTGAKIQTLAVRILPRSGSPEALMAMMGIDAKGIVKAVLAL